MFRESPLKDFNTVFNFKIWPSDRTSLALYGRDGLENILKFFEPIFDETKDSILNEYLDLKVCIAHYKTMPIYEAYLLVSETASPKFTHLQKVIDLMLSVSCSSAKCERVFSSMKLMKTRLRSNLSQENLQAQINVMVEGPPLHEFKASKAIEHWLGSSRGRHVNGHQAPERKSRQNENDLYNYDEFEVYEK